MTWPNGVRPTERLAKMIRVGRALKGRREPARSSWAAPGMARLRPIVEDALGIR